MTSASAAQGRLFPDIPSFETPLADPRVLGFAGRVVQQSLGDDQFGRELKADVRAGEDFPIIALRRGDHPVTLGFGVQVAGHFSLDDAKSALISNDWLVGFNTHFDFHPVELTVEIYHESSHLGDEYARRFTAKRIDWTREVLAAWVGYRAGGFRLIGSVGTVLIDELALSPWQASAGVDFRSPGFAILGQRGQLVSGVFVEGASATEWLLSQSGKVGLAFPGGRVGRELRVSLIGHNGLSTQRQFFRARSRYIGMEIEFQL
jgi:hypothetical protein